MQLKRPNLARFSHCKRPAESSERHVRTPVNTATKAKWYRLVWGVRVCMTLCNGVFFLSSSSMLFSNIYIDVLSAYVGFCAFAAVKGKNKGKRAIEIAIVGLLFYALSLYSSDCECSGVKRIQSARLTSEQFSAVFRFLFLLFASQFRHSIRVLLAGARSRRVSIGQRWASNRPHRSHTIEMCYT